MSIQIKHGETQSPHKDKDESGICMQVRRKTFKDERDAKINKAVIEKSVHRAELSNFLVLLSHVYC